MEHSTLVAALCKPGEEIVDSLNSVSAHNLHMALGIAGEAGEVVDAVKKNVIYCKPSTARTSLKSSVIWSSTWKVCVRALVLQGKNA